MREERLWQGDPRFDQMAFFDYVSSAVHDRDWSRGGIDAGLNGMIDADQR